MADPDRKGGGGLSLRTLTIASAASLTAAMVTSRLFPPGTIYASAFTPIVVAAVSEMLNRPADRLSELRRQRRTMVMQAHTLQHARVRGDEPPALAGAPEFAQGAAADEVLSGNGSGRAAPITIHGRRRGVRRVLHPKVWIVTGLASFAIAVAVLTLPELIFGGAVATSHRTTFFGGGSTPTHTQTTPTATTPAKTGTQTTTTPTQTAPAQTPPSTQTQTTTSTGTQTSPNGGASAPAGTTSGTSTTTTPGGAVVPPAP